MRARALGGRLVMFVAGSILSTWCYAVTIREHLGLGPLFALQDGIARTTGIAISTAVTLVGVGLIVVAAFLRTWPYPGTLALPFLGGANLAWTLPITPAVHGWLASVAVVVVATWLMALGGVLTIRCSFGSSSYDQVMLSIHRLTGWPMFTIRLGMELVVLAVGWMLGGAVGVGTVITGLLIGPSLQFWLRLLGGVPKDFRAGAAARRPVRPAWVGRRSQQVAPAATTWSEPMRHVPPDAVAASEPRAILRFSRRATRREGPA